MLRAIKFDRYTVIGAEQVHFHSAPIVEWNWQFDVQAETPLCCRQSFQTAI
jgi:hypothetical protein